MIKETFTVSRIAKPRSIYEVLAHLVQEAGELAQEVEIEGGYIEKPKGEDGIIGEAIDVIICALDIIWVNKFGIPDKDLEDQINQILKQKLEKWKAKQQVL